MRWAGWMVAWLLGFFAVTPVAAHPHVWADVQAEMSIAAGYVDGIWTQWTFDDVFSQLILADHDDGDGRLTPQESASVKKGYFDNLKAYDFFTHLVLGTKDLAVPLPQQFLASVDAQGRMRYRFFLPLALRLDAKTPFSVSFYDSSFFTEMKFASSAPLTLQVTDGGRASLSWKKDTTRTFYGGQVTPTFAVIQWSPK